MSKTMRTMVLTLVSIMCCIAVIAVGTYALFTDEVTVKNQLQAGTLKVTLERTELVWNKLDADGYLVSNKNNPDRTVVNFSDTTTATANIFGLTNDEVVVPQSSYKAKMRVTNGGNVAFGCWFQTSIESGSDENLAKQLIMKIYKADGTTLIGEAATVKEGYVVGDQSNAVVVETDGEMEFWVEIYFADSDNSDDRDIYFDENTGDIKFDNNDAMSKGIKFDLIVSAVQLTERA